MMSMPALFTSTSTWPHASTVFATIRSTSAFTEVSTFSASALRPSAVASAAVFSTSASVRLTATTSAPCSARPSAIVLPRPRPAPVTMATLPVRSKSLLMATCLSCGDRRRRHPRAPVAAQLPDVHGHDDEPEPDDDLAEGRQPGRVEHGDDVLREARALEHDHEDGRAPHGPAHGAGTADDHRHPGVESDLRRELVRHDVGDVVRPQAARDGGQPRAP